MVERGQRGGAPGPRQDFLDWGALADRWLGWASGAAVAIAVGAIAAIAIRTSGLRWTWALPLAGVVPLAFLVDIEAGVFSATGSGVALAAGLAWDARDRRRGRSEAARVGERPGIGTVPRALWTLPRARRRRLRGDRFALGETRQRRVRTIPFGSRQGVRGLVVGAPGAGKTVTMAAIAAAYVEAGLPVVVVDPKGDAQLGGALRELGEALGRRYLEWSTEGPATYNPLGRGDSTEVADKALAGETWSEPHYLRQAQRYLGWVFRAIEAAGEAASLPRLVELMDPDRLEGLAGELGDDASQRLYAYLDSLSVRQRAELAGVRDRLAVLAESRLGRWLDSGGEGEEIDLARVWSERAIAYFRLDADRYPLASQMLGAAIVSDLVSLTGELQGSPALGLVAIDEFAAVGAEAISRVLSRSRSAGISVLVGTQGLADLDVARPDDGTASLTRQVLQYMDFIVAHRQAEPAGAETLAMLAGTRPTWTQTERVTPALGPHSGPGEGTRTRVREFARHPDEFKRLRVGEAMVIESAAQPAAEPVRVWPGLG